MVNTSQSAIDKFSDISGEVDNGEVVFCVFTDGDICAEGIAKVTQV